MGPINKAAASLYDILTSGSAQVAGGNTIHLSDLTGQPCEVAIASIVQALTPENGDQDKIRVAMNYALAEALDGKDTFDFDSITDEVIVNTLISFLAESIYIEIVMNSGDAWKKAKTPEDENYASEALRELIKVLVDQKMAPTLVGNTRFLNREGLIQLQRKVIDEVWKEWGNYQ